MLLMPSVPPLGITMLDLCRVVSSSSPHARSYKVVKRMCLIQAAFMILRFVPGMAPGYKGMTPGAMADIPAAQLEK